VTVRDTHNSVRHADLQRLLEAQQHAFARDPEPTVAVRRSRMDRLLAVLLDNSDAFIEAISADFGQRSAAATLGTDILGPLSDVLFIRRKIAAWSRPRRLRPGLHTLLGTRVRVEPRPLGVVGIMAPWNFPLTLALQPAFAALAAGNRVMIKLSEVTPRTAEVLAVAVAKAFHAEELAIVVGDVDVSAAFSSLAFDHLFFTGSPSTGKLIQRAAADNLVPVTLELGGKNPAVIARDADLATAAKRITAGRMTNGGQLCLSPDYALVPRASMERFLDEAEANLRRMFPSIAGDEQYPWVVNQRSYERLESLLADARDKGAAIRTVMPEGEQASSVVNRWMPPHLVCGLTDGMALLEEEVFGPILSVVPYDDVDEAIAHIGARPSPLAAYWFGSAGADYKRFALRVRCGGITRNDFALHVLPNGAPFGGVGSSGSGYYHGKAGFDTFSHLRTNAAAPKTFSIMSFASPPFHPRAERMMRRTVTLLGRFARRREQRSGRAVAREAARRSGRP
jgi:coniferyl-aldehyde dehydrogenase